MTLFIFAGDMLVMLFMMVLVTWVSFYASEESLNEAAAIPLNDENDESDEENNG